MAKEHDTWCFSVLGIDVGGALQKTGSAIGGAATAVLHESEAVGSAIGHRAAGVGSAAVDAGRTVLGTAENLAHKAVAVASDAGHAVAGKVHDALHPDEAKLKACVALDDQFEKQMKRIDDQVAKVTKAGLDPGHLAAKARELRADHDRVKAEKNLDARQRDTNTLVTQATQEADRDMADTTRGTASAVEGIDKAVADMRASTAKLIGKLDHKNQQKPQLAKRLDELDKEIESERKEQDRAKRNRQLKLVQRDAEALLDDAATAAKDTGVVQATYKQALMDRYGFAVSGKAGVSTHNDRVYKMFELTPDLDKMQEKLTVLKYDDTMPGGGHTPAPSIGAGTARRKRPRSSWASMAAKRRSPTWTRTANSPRPRTPSTSLPSTSSATRSMTASAS